MVVSCRHWIHSHGGDLLIHSPADDEIQNMATLMHRLTDMLNQIKRSQKINQYVCFCRHIKVDVEILHYDRWDHRERYVTQQLF